MNLSVGKLPRPAPGEFRFTTKAIVAESDEGKRRFRTVASSTVKDMGGDEMKLTALQDMESAFKRGVLIFMNHKYDAPDSGFGMSDWAEIKDSGARDPKTNAPIYDLHIAGFVDEANPKAVQLHESMEGGMRWGTSVGAIVKKHARNASGGLDIEHVDLKEGSIVGIPMNQRSWTQKAANAVANLEDATAAGLLDEDDDEEETPEAPLVVETVTAGVEDANAITTKNEGLSAEPETEIPLGDTTSDPSSDGQEAEGATPEPAQGQEAEGATPETASDDEADDEPEPETDKGIVDPADVGKLLIQVRGLIEEIGALRAENTSLTDEIKTLKAVHTEADAIKDTVEKIMGLPLQRKAVDMLTSLPERFPQMDPAVIKAIQRVQESK
jgi:hypothetical protein